MGRIFTVPVSALDLDLYGRVLNFPTVCSRRGTVRRRPRIARAAADDARVWTRAGRRRTSKRERELAGAEQLRIAHRSVKQLLAVVCC